MVEGDDLESRCGGDLTAGSNPALSERNGYWRKSMPVSFMGRDENPFWVRARVSGGWSAFDKE